MNEKLGFSAKIVLDSIAPDHDARITTMELCYPRFIHAEAKTHRIMNIDDQQIVFGEDISVMNEKSLSRNAMSSRAIPVAKMLAQVRENPAMPIHWGANQPGMQAGAEHDTFVAIPAYLIGAYADFWAVHRWMDVLRELPPDGERFAVPAQDAWRFAAWLAADMSQAFADAGYHKQVSNRPTEPYQWMRVIITATDWDNFFALRLSELADPNMYRLAGLMRDAIDNSNPDVNAIHMPYVSDSDRIQMPDPMQAAMASAARCARISFLNHDGSYPIIAKDLALATTLRDAQHASPFEHVAFAANSKTVRSRNFQGWMQLREIISL